MKILVVKLDYVSRITCARDVCSLRLHALVTSTRNPHTKCSNEKPLHILLTDISPLVLDQLGVIASPWIFHIPLRTFWRILFMWLPCICGTLYHQRSDAAPHCILSRKSCLNIFYHLNINQCPIWGLTCKKFFMICNAAFSIIHLPGNGYEQ